MNRSVYSWILRCGTPLLKLRVRMRTRQEAGYGVAPGERFARYGDSRPDSRRPIWIHAVSLGETRAVGPLIEEFLADGYAVLLTHMTATGRAEGARLFGEAIAEGHLRQAWLPYDLPDAARRFIDHFRPIWGILVEREIWPNLIVAATQAGIPVALINARLSERSAQRGRYAGRVLREAYAALEQVYALSDVDAARLTQAGAQRVKVVGNMKFDVQTSAQQLALGRSWSNAWQRRTVAIASTHEGEEKLFLAALGAWNDTDTLYILVPRHPQRFEAVAALLEANGVSHVRRSRIDPSVALAPNVRVLLGDTLGELGAYYAACDVAVVAGAFAGHGGHNIMEAFAAGAPAIVGPDTHNFSEVVKEAIDCGAALRADDMAQALDQAAALLENPVRLSAMRYAGRNLLELNAGVTRRLYSELIASLRATQSRPHKTSA